MVDLGIKFCGVKFANPTVLASGILGVTASSLKNVILNGAGGVTTKSIWLEEHKGHRNPTMFGTENYFINAVGLSDAGIEKAISETFPEYNDEKPAPIIASIVAGKIDDFGLLAEKISECDPDIIEVNISCPNVESEFGKPFACVVTDAAAVTKVVRARTKKPVIIKLSPNVSNIGEIAKACMAAGADGFCAVNTFGPGLAIDINTRMPILTNKVGGISGPGIKPLAVKCVYDVFKATGAPIVGTGGVLTGEDVVEMMMVGARLVGMGTMVYYRGVEGFKKVVVEVEEWCEKNGVKNLEEIIGTVKI
ncbi:dihydroorotate dehydrogenase [Candidatus Peregrinibacteria bacterium CG_4_10_14_0_2_um_filter_38_24]|nr:MAG: dihydroorotate dehydrogenase [Candidatus Peregrinibacteria bacterium CG_4_10_14_0_2_um_filter_38_24]